MEGKEEEAEEEKEEGERRERKRKRMRKRKRKRRKRGLNNNYTQSLAFRSSTKFSLHSVQTECVRPCVETLVWTPQSTAEAALSDTHPQDQAVAGLLGTTPACGECLHTRVAASSNL